MKEEILEEKQFNAAIRKAYKKEELRKMFHARIEIEQRMFETLIETSHPVLFFHRNKMKKKLKDFFEVFNQVYERKIEEIYQ